MEIKASLNNFRTSAQKVRLVLDVVRKMRVDKALEQLTFLNKGASLPVKKLIASAAANAKSAYDIPVDNLFVKEIRADEGQTLKRWMPRAHGRATSLRKRSCHIHVTLGEINDSGPKEKKVLKIEAPVKLEAVAEEAKKTAKKAEVETKANHAKGEAKGTGFKQKVFRRKAG